MREVKFVNLKNESNSIFFIYVCKLLMTLIYKKKKKKKIVYHVIHVKERQE